MIVPNKEFWEIFKQTEGALSCAEAIAIMNIAAQAPIGIAIEFGTYKGKSAMSAAKGLKTSSSELLRFYLLDPEFDDDKWCGDVLIRVCKFIDGRYIILPSSEYSTGYLKKYNEEYSYVFVDSGSHQDGLPMQEVKLLEDRIVKNGIIAFHDFRSQFVEVEQAYNYLLSTGKYEEIKINWDEINAYVDENNLEDGNSTWHHTEMKNPNFVGALRRK